MVSTSTKSLPSFLLKFSSDVNCFAFSLHRYCNRSIIDILQRCDLNRSMVVRPYMLILITLLTYYSLDLYINCCNKNEIVWCVILQR